MISFPIAWADKIDAYYRKYGFNMNQDVPGCVQAWQSFYEFIISFVDNNIDAKYRSIETIEPSDNVFVLANAVSEIDSFVKTSYYDIIKESGPQIINFWMLAKKGADTYAVSHMDPEWTEMYTRYNKVDLEL